jgi:hypothetical protein
MLEQLLVGHLNVEHPRWNHNIVTHIRSSVVCNSTVWSGVRFEIHLELTTPAYFLRFTSVPLDKCEDI